MMTEDKIDRIEKVLKTSFKLTRFLRRAHNRVTKVFDENFEVFEKDIVRNTANIDKIVETLEALMGEGKSKLVERKEDDYTRRLYK